MSFLFLVRSREVSNEFFISQVRESIARHTSKLDCTKVGSDRL